MIEVRPRLQIDKFRLDLDPKDLLPARERILSLDELVGLLEEARKYYLIASTSGSFDVIHVGHLRYIQDLVAVTTIRSQLHKKDPLVIIGVNSDESTRRNRENRAKGRPVFSEERRAEVVAGFKGVHTAFIFDQDLDLVKLNPDIFQVFTLSDHAPETRPEVLLMKERGAEIITIHDDQRPDSTSAILRRIHNNNIC